MNYLIRNAVLIDPGGPNHRECLDLHVKDGRVVETGKNLVVEGAMVWDLNGVYCSPGWIDIGPHSGDPGFEQREDFFSLSSAAAAGGFTGLACFPNTNPVVQSKSGILYMLQQSARLPVDIYPIGALSTDCGGSDLTEMMDMHAAGAVAFSDGKQAVQHAGLMLRALLYVKAFNGLVINRPMDEAIAPHGQMHEGFTSTTLGLSGIPALAEELIVQRDLDLLAYTGSRLLLHNISSARSVTLIRQAKAQGLAVTASVAAMNLFFTDEDLADFDSNLKVSPPLRSEADRQGLLAGLQEGVIDLVSSNHTPLEEEEKKLEFPYAKPGAIGLETAFAALNSQNGAAFSPETLVEVLALRPRQVLNLPRHWIEKGAPANFTFFDPDKEWVFSEGDIRSKSRNTPFIGKTLKGRVLGILNKGQLLRS